MVLLFIIPIDNKATTGDLQGYNSQDYQIVNAEIVQHNPNNVVVKVFSNPKDFYLTFDIQTNDELIINGGALIAKYKNDPLDGTYSSKTPVALSKKGHLVDQVLKFLHIGTSNVYEGKIIKKSYSL